MIEEENEIQMEESAMRQETGLAKVGKNCTPIPVFSFFFFFIIAVSFLRPQSVMKY